MATRSLMTHAAFMGTELLAEGSLVDVALATKAHETAAGASSPVVFDMETARIVDLDLRGDDNDIRARYDCSKPTETAKGTALEAATQVVAAQKRARGRPKLGVVAREVTLLPRHWEWLASQRGGASAALRRLVSDAIARDGGKTQQKETRERVYRFLSTIGGDLPGFEEVARALFAGDAASFHKRLAVWPVDVRTCAARLAVDAFERSGDHRIAADKAQ